MFIPSLVLGFLCLAFDWEWEALELPVFAFFSDEIFGEAHQFTLIRDNLTLEILGIAYTIGAMLIGFSRMKDEDEFVSAIRYDALMWSTFISCILLILGMLFVYGLPFMWCMIFNMFSVPTIFVARFSYLYWKSNHIQE